MNGFVIAIEEEGGRPAAFTVDTEQGPVRILIDEKTDYGFDLPHLEQHRTQAQPVSVEVEERNGQKVARKIYDG